MGFLLLWIESLVAVLLLTAAGIAVASRRRSQWPVVLAVLPVFAIAIYGAYAFAVADTSGPGGSTADTLKAALLAWIATAVVIASILMLMALRKRGEPQQPRARDWPALRLALCGSASIVLYAVTILSMSNALMSRVAALRAEAGSLALAAAPARLPDHENAARYYEAAYELLREGERPDDRVKLDAWLAADKLNTADPELQQYLARRAAGVELIRQAVKMPGCWFDASPAQQLGAMERVNQVRAAAAVLTLQTRMDIATYQSPERIELRRNSALNGIAGLMQMARHVAGNSDVNAMLAAAALESNTLTMIDQLLAPGFLLDQKSERGVASPSIRQDPILYRADLRRALQAEQALVYARLSGIVEQATGFGLLFLEDELAANHALFQRMADELAKPYPECLRGWADLESDPAVKSATLHRMGAQAYARLLPAIARADACRRVSLFALTVANYRIDYGKFPEPGQFRRVPTDPYTGQPLKMKAIAEGMVVYSVGPDGVDDGGQPLNEDRPPKGDIRVRIGGNKPESP